MADTTGVMILFLWIYINCMRLIPFSTLIISCNRLLQTPAAVAKAAGCYWDSTGNVESRTSYVKSHVRNAGGCDGIHGNGCGGRSILFGLLTLESVGNFTLLCFFSSQMWSLHHILLGLLGSSPSVNHKKCRRKNINGELNHPLSTWWIRWGFL